MPLKAHNWVCNWIAFFGFIGLVFFLSLKRSKLRDLKLNRPKIDQLRFKVRSIAWSEILEQVLINWNQLILITDFKVAWPRRRQN